MKECDIIDRYFNFKLSEGDSVLVGIGDDGAVLKPPKNKDLVMSMDTLIEGVHFFPHMAPYDLGYRALAVNLSDLAAMGAEPAWAMLSLTLPQIEEPWLKFFSAGFFDLAKEYNVSLVGGDITKGLLSVTVHVTGWVEKNRAVKRSGAKPGDQVAVSGTLGEGAWALKLKQHHKPIPHVKQGLLLQDKATAMIDVSDGLAADLQHILKASGVGATLIVENLPLFNPQVTPQMALSGGDDYVLCFTLPPQAALPPGMYIIGRIEEQPGLRIEYKNGEPLTLTHLGYQHFE